MQMQQMQQRQIDQMTEQLRSAVERADKAEADRTELMRATIASKSRDIVDIKGVGQPFKFSGGQDQDFQEWVHKMRTFVTASFGEAMVTALKWASQQKEIIRDLATSDREVAYHDIFGVNSDPSHTIEGIDNKVTQLYTYLVSFTTGSANKIVRNSGEGAGLEAWKRLQQKYDPTSSMKRVAILGKVQNPPRCQKIEDLGHALEEWLALKRRYEEFTDLNGQACRVSDDTLMAAMYKMIPHSLEETVMFHPEQHETFEELYDQLVAYADTKRSVQTTKDKHEVNSMSKGKGKGKGKGGKDKGKGKSKDGKGKGPTHTTASGTKYCSNCNSWTHWTSECWHKGKGNMRDKGGKDKDGRASKGKGREKGKDNQGKGKSNSGWYHTPRWHNGVWSIENQFETDWNTSSWPDEKAHNQAPPQSSTSTPSLGAVEADVPLYHIGDDDESWKIRYKGEDWMRINYDTGAAKTALPVSLVKGTELTKKGEFVVASGDTIANYGEAQLQVKDELGSVRKFRGSVTEVHKPLASAADLSKHHDTFLSESGGVLIPKRSAVAQGLRTAYKNLVRRYGSHGIMPLHREGKLYNFYLKKASSVDLCPIDSGTAGSSASQGPSPGGPWQVSRP